MQRATLETMSRRCCTLQPLIVTFAIGADGFRMLSTLINLSTQDLVRFESGILALAIVSSQDWDRTNRKLTMYFAPPLWAHEDFLKLADRGIERIEVGGDSPIKALQSKKRKRREEAVEEIKQNVLDETLRWEFGQWGIAIETVVVDEDELWSLEIVCSAGSSSFTITLDAWSGNIMNSEGQIAGFCPGYETAQRVLREELGKYTERATS